MDIQEQLKLDSLFAAIEQSIQQEVPGVSVRQIFESLMNGTFEFDLVSFFSQILQPLYGEIAVQCTFLGQTILLAVLYALLRRMSADFSGNLQELCALMMRSIAILLLLQSGTAVFSYVQEVLLRLANLMQILLPVQLTLMTLLGNIQTAGLLEPSLMLIVRMDACVFGVDTSSPFFERLTCLFTRIVLFFSSRSSHSSASISPKRSPVVISRK